MQILRTPDARFEALTDWPYAPKYFEVTDAEGTAMRLHYVDEGPPDGAPVLVLHGEPSWAYLYRNIIAGLVARGHRVIAPDLIGFGRSDKPTKRTNYTYERHVAWMSQWLVGLDLKNLRLFCQDWGGLIGLRLVAAFPERFAGLVISNTGMPVGTGMSEGFKAWLEFSQNVPQMPIGMIVNMGTTRNLTDAEIAAYDAPFPDETFKEGARQFPTLVPVTPEHASVAENIEAWKVLEKFDKPVVTAFSDNDPVSRGGDLPVQARIPGTKGQPHVTLSGGHFLQEDCPADIVEILDALIRRS